MNQARQAPSGHNEISIRGRLVHDPSGRTLPSGDELVSVRVSMPRPERHGPSRRRPGTDWIDCALWTSRLRRAAARWNAGDWVEITGAVRRRYRRDGTGGWSTVEVDARTARRVARSDRSQS